MPNRIYVGTKRVGDSWWLRELFRSPAPIAETLGAKNFAYCAGPFRTVRGAKFAVHFGWTGNPHVIDIDHCERLAAEFKAMLATLPRHYERV